MTNQFEIYCDGGSRGNPGHAASAFVVMNNKNVFHKEVKYLGIKTNNFAEYSALLMAIKWILENKDIITKDITIFVDSQLIHRQVTGVYKIKNKNLKVIFTLIKNIENSLKKNITYFWTRRINNKIADYLVNQELDKKLQREKQ